MTEGMGEWPLDVPVWARELCTADDTDETALRARFADLLAQHLSSVLPADVTGDVRGDTVLIRWSGDVAAEDMATTPRLGWVYEDRGAWIAWLDDFRPEEWPAPLRDITVVFRPRA